MPFLITLQLLKTPFQILNLLTQSMYYYDLHNNNQNMPLNLLDCKTNPHIGQPFKETLSNNFDCITLSTIIS